MASGFLSDLTAKNGTAAISTTAQHPTIPCLDWIIPGMCSFTCKHCHPEAGMKAAKVRKMYYCVAGESVDVAGLYILDNEAASSVARMIHKGQIQSGFRVEIMGKACAVTDNTMPEVYPYAIPQSSVRLYLRDGRLVQYPAAPQRLWFGEHFCGLGMLHYHNDCSQDQRDIIAAQNNYTEEIIRQFIAEDTNTRS